MADIPESDLAETRAALAPTLEATAAILPWLAKPRPARFDGKLNERWVAAGRRLSAAWSTRHGSEADAVRPAIFALYAIAIETADADCLRLGEALACAADRLEDPDLSPRLIAAISAAIECLDDASGLEHPAFAERAGHFAGRLEASARARHSDDRSAIVDRLFVDEAHEQIQWMRDALAALPPDAYALTTEALKLAQQAELLEIWGVGQQARQFFECVSQNATDLDSGSVRSQLVQQLAALSRAITAINR